MSPELEAAMHRMAAALGALESSLARRAEIDGSRGDLETELQLMQDDRARLAAELEGAAARLGRLETATDHVERRVRHAVGIIGEVLAESEAEAATSHAGREA